MEALPVVIGLGIAGFDPLGALTLIAAMAMRASHRAVAALLASTLASTLALTLVLSSTVGNWVIAHLHHLPDPGHLVWGGLVLAGGIALLGWGIIRLTRSPKPEKPRKTRAAASVGGLIVLGTGIGLSALIDPAFYAFVVLAGSLHSWPVRVLACLIWVVMIQSALIALAIAVFTDNFDRAIEAVWRARDRWSATFYAVASWLLVVLGGLLVIEGIAELHGSWLLP